jgi:hypothetical protein
MTDDNTVEALIARRPTVTDLDFLLERAKAICEAATPGPWKTYQNGTAVGSDAANICGIHDGGRGLASPTRHQAGSMEADATFIAEARTLLPALVEALEAERAEVRKAICGLMLSDTMGDVHEEIDVLRKVAGLSPLEGDKNDGWTDADFEGVEPSAH